MNERMLKLAMNTLWCDIKHSFRGYNAFLILLIISVSLLELDGTTVLCFAFFIEMAMMKLMPSCERILFIMPISAKDRKRLMVYRQAAMEMIFVILILCAAWVRFLIYGQRYALAKGIINNVFAIALAFFEMGSAVYFCEWYRKVSTREKGFGIFFSILAWVAFFTATMLSAENVKGNELLMLILGFGGILVQALVKMYYMICSSFEEYKLVDVNEGLNGRKNKKMNAADERF